MANYPIPYQNNWNYSGLFPQYQQSMAQTPMQPTNQTAQGGPGMIWVDGEVGAKAYQMPAGWPANQPIALWDTNDTVIYLKSTNPMGMPAPLQKAQYKLVDYKQVGQMSGDDKPDMSEYVRKDDLERMKQDLMDTIGQMQTSGTGIRKTASKGE